MQPCSPRLLLLCPLLALTASADVDLWTVDPAGGPADFVSVQDAIDAASEGDVVLIDSSALIPIPAVDGFEVDGKALTIIAQPFEGPFGSKQVCEPSAVRNLGPEQEVVLRGMQFTSSGEENLPSLRIEDCLGAVFVEECSLTAGLQLDKREALRIEDCDTVVLARCMLDAGSGNPFGVLSSGDPAIVSIRSTLLLYGSEVWGGGGKHDGGLGVGNPLFGLPGQAAAVNEDGTLFASGCALTGGMGGDGAIETFGCLEPGPGGNAVVTLGRGQTTLHDVALLAGVPGKPAPGCGPVNNSPEIGGEGEVSVIPGEAHGLIAPAPVKTGQPAGFVLTGQPGDLALLEVATQHDVHLELGIWSSLPDSSPAFFVGIIGPEGKARWKTGSAPAPPPGHAAQVWWFQGRFVTLGGSMAISNPSIAVVLGTSP